ncbi:MAG: phosphoribosyl-AMP cyclohydrolase [Pseudomonadota bacterium]
MDAIETATQEISWNEQGLVAAIAQDWETGDVLMMAWMNAEALTLTLREQRAVYWSRSRGKLWRKGESSGNVQRLVELRVDCDRDAILMKVEQVGGIACHTGRRSCFSWALAEEGWQATDPVLKDPAEIYSGDR